MPSPKHVFDGRVCSVRDLLKLRPVLWERNCKYMTRTLVVQGTVRVEARGDHTSFTFRFVTFYKIPHDSVKREITRSSCSIFFQTSFCSISDCEICAKFDYQSAGFKSCTLWNPTMVFLARWNIVIPRVDSASTTIVISLYFHSFSASVEPVTWNKHSLV